MMIFQLFHFGTNAMRALPPPSALRPPSSPSICRVGRFRFICTSRSKVPPHFLCRLFGRPLWSCHGRPSRVIKQPGTNQQLQHSPFTPTPVLSMYSRCALVAVALAGETCMC